MAIYTPLALEHSPFHFVICQKLALTLRKRNNIYNA